MSSVLLSVFSTSPYPPLCYLGGRMRRAVWVGRQRVCAIGAMGPTLLDPSRDNCAVRGVKVRPQGFHHCLPRPARCQCGPAHPHHSQPVGAGPRTHLLRPERPCGKRHPLRARHTLANAHDAAAPDAATAPDARDPPAPAHHPPLPTPPPLPTLATSFGGLR